MLGVCAFYILLTSVSTELDISASEQTWVVVGSQTEGSADWQTAFGLTFGSFLLFWGRVVDIYVPKTLFCAGLLSFGVFSVVISFVTDKYAFLVLRGLAGIAAAALIPAAYRLITDVFDKEELSMAFTVYSLAGSLAGASGVVVGGILTMIPEEGQMKDWRWFFRLTAIIV